MPHSSSSSQSAAAFLSPSYVIGGLALLLLSIGGVWLWMDKNSTQTPDSAQEEKRVQEDDEELPIEDQLEEKKHNPPTKPPPSPSPKDLSTKQNKPTSSLTSSTPSFALRSNTTTYLKIAGLLGAVAYVVYQSYSTSSQQKKPPHNSPKEPTYLYSYKNEKKSGNYKTFLKLANQKKSKEEALAMLCSLDNEPNKTLFYTHFMQPKTINPEDCKAFIGILNSPKDDALIYGFLNARAFFLDTSSIHLVSQHNRLQLAPTSEFLVHLMDGVHQHLLQAHNESNQKKSDEEGVSVIYNKKQRKIKEEYEKIMNLLITWSKKNKDHFKCIFFHYDHDSNGKAVIHNTIFHQIIYQGIFFLTISKLKELINAIGFGEETQFPDLNSIYTLPDIQDPPLIEHTLDVFYKNCNNAWLSVLEQFILLYVDCSKQELASFFALEGKDNKTIAQQWIEHDREGKAVNGLFINQDKFTKKQITPIFNLRTSEGRSLLLDLALKHNVNVLHAFIELFMKKGFSPQEVLDIYKDKEKESYSLLKEALDNNHTDVMKYLAQPLIANKEAFQHFCAIQIEGKNWHNYARKQEKGWEKIGPLLAICDKEQIKAIFEEATDPKKKKNIILDNIFDIKKEENNIIDKGNIAQKIKQLLNPLTIKGEDLRSNKTPKKQEDNNEPTDQPAVTSNKERLEVIFDMTFSASKTTSENIWFTAIAYECDKVLKLLVGLVQNDPDFLLDILKKHNRKGTDTMLHKIVQLNHNQLQKSYIQTLLPKEIFGKEEYKDKIDDLLKIKKENGEGSAVNELTAYSNSYVRTYIEELKNLPNNHQEDTKTDE